MFIWCLLALSDATRQEGGKLPAGVILLCVSREETMFVILFLYEIVLKLS